jgi:hypothetical protein
VYVEVYDTFKQNTQLKPSSTGVINQAWDNDLDSLMGGTSQSKPSFPTASTTNMSATNSMHEMGYLIPISATADNVSTRSSELEQPSAVRFFLKAAN